MSGGEGRGGGRRSAVALAGGLVLLGAVGAVAQHSIPSVAARAAVDRAGVTPAGARTAVGQVLVCPDVEYVPGTEQTEVGIASSSTGGVVVTMPAAGSPAGPNTALSGGRQATVLAHPPAGPLAIEATGPIANGLRAEQLSRANSTSLRGWADAPCTAPQAQQWFIGPGTGVGETPVLTLSDPDSSPALVDVSVLTPAGPASSQAGQGIALGPHSARQLALATLAPGAGATAVEVSTLSGRVAASLRDVRVSGTTPLGTDYAPPVSGPQNVVTIPGVPGLLLDALPARELVLANPGALDLTAQVSVSTAEGSYVPTGLAALAVPAGTVRTVSLAAALPATAGAAMLTVRSSAGGALLAGVLVDAASAVTGIHEIAYLGAAPALAGPGIVPVNPTGSTVRSLLVLSAPVGAGRVAVTVSRPGGLVTHLAGIPAGRTVELELSGYGADGGAVTVTPVAGSGPVYGVRIIAEQGARGPLIAAFPLLGAAPSVPVPAVAPAPLSLP